MFSLPSAVFLANLVLFSAATPVDRTSDAYSKSGYSDQLSRHQSVANNATRVAQSTIRWDQGTLYTSVIVGGKNFNLILDTGSSDTWLAETGFQCVSDSAQNISEAMCGFGKTFTPDNNFKVITGEFYENNYGGGANTTGILGSDTVTVAGINVSAQTIAVVNDTFWNGDNITSGLLGLAYPALTSAYPDGTPGRSNPYSPILNTIFLEQNLTAPIFSIAVSRISPHNSNYAGTFTLGGTPNLTSPSINVTNDTFTTAPILKTNHTSSTFQYEYYTINVDGFTYNGNSTPAGAAKYFIDSGTTFNVLPSPQAAEINSLFSPPASRIPNNTDSNYYVPCNAIAPRVSVTIAGRTFDMNPADLIWNTTDFGNGTCLSGIQDGGEIDGNSLFTLGDVFMANVLVVFDWGKEEVRIAAREEYSTDGMGL